MSTVSRVEGGGGGGWSTELEAENIFQRLWRKETICGRTGKSSSKETVN